MTKLNLTASDCMNAFDDHVLVALSKVSTEERDNISTYGGIGELILSKLHPFSVFSDELDDMRYAILMSLTRLSDLDLVNETCIVSREPHRKVPLAHLPDKVAITSLPRLEQWVYELIVGGFDMADERVFINMAERLPPELLADLANPTDEVSRAWLRLSYNNYFDSPFANQIVTQAKGVPRPA